MNAVETFVSDKTSLSGLLQEIAVGKTQLPDFQRGWVWDDPHIRDLLASVSQSYPIGAVMMLETGGSEIRFKPRPIEGVLLANSVNPDQLILDGQQRLTSLYQALMSDRPASTRDSRGKPIHRWYYLDIKAALDPSRDREEAVRSIPEDRLVRNFRGGVEEDYSTIEKECAAELLPLSIILDTPRLTAWQMTYLQANQSQFQERLSRWNDLVQNVILRFQQYQIPIIVLKKEIPKEAVCQVFEKVNTGGVALTVFELLTATYAADNFNLRDDWASREKKLRNNRVLNSLESTDFLQAITLLTSYQRRRQVIAAGMQEDITPAVTCKRKDVLRLTLGNYRDWADAVSMGFERAGKFLFSQKFFSARDLPYRTQLVPLAAIFTFLQDKGDLDGIQRKLAQWYWCGVFGELYGSSVESRFARDLVEVLEWLEGGSEPSTVHDANFVPARLYTLRNRNSAAYKGLHAHLMAEGGLDFISGVSIDAQAYFDESVDIHHIFPQAWCKENGIDAGRCDCIVNKTPLSARTNRIIGGNSPGRYLENVQKKADIAPSRMDEILASHLIDPVNLRRDDFNAFFRERENALLARIEKAMGKPIARQVLDLEPEVISSTDYDESEDAA